VVGLHFTGSSSTSIFRFAVELSRKKNVLGLGRVPARSGRAGERDLAVYVERKIPSDELAEEDLVPKTLELPSKGKDGVQITTQVIEQGKVGLEFLNDEIAGPD
jgi:hypothetical protein